MKCLYATIKNTHKGGRSRPSSTTAHIKSYDKITCQSCECGGPRESTYDWHGNFIMRLWCAQFFDRYRHVLWQRKLSPLQMEKRKGSVNGLVAMSNKQQAEKSSDWTFVRNDHLILCDMANFTDLSLWPHGQKGKRQRRRPIYLSTFLISDPICCYCNFKKG